MLVAAKEVVVCDKEVLVGAREVLVAAKEVVGYQVSLRCPSCEEYGSCGKKQEAPVQVSSRHPTELACLQELLRRLQDRHVDCAEVVAKKDAADAASAATVNPDTPNVLQVMMQLEQAKTRAKTANRVALFRNRDKRVADIVVRELKRAKPDAWGCIQAREV